MTKIIEKFKAAIKKVLKLFGYTIIKADRINTGWNKINTDSEPETIIDIGAAYGTPQLYSKFPNAYLFLVDPIKEYTPYLRNICQQRRGDFEIKALAEKKKTINLNINKDRLVLSSIHDRTSLTKRKDNKMDKRKIKTSTLDNLIKQKELKPPFGLKIDTEGHELEVLKGAEKNLKDTDFIIVEVSIQKRFEDSYKTKELIQFLWDKNFKIKNILSANSDGNGLVRYLDILFVKKQ